LDFLMQSMMFLTIGGVTMAAYLSSIGVVPATLKFLPEMLSGLAILYVLVAGIHQRFALVNIKYWLAFSTLVMLLLCGAVANDVAPGPIISGMRYFLRAIPFFFLPAVYDFKDWQLRQYLQILVTVCLLQVPIAAYERYSIMASGHTSNADAVYGTLMQTGVLALFLTCALCLLGAAMLRGRLSKLTFGICFLLFMIPLSISETKITVIVLPLGLLLTFILGAPAHKRLAASLAAAATLAVGGAIFVPVFDYYQAKSAVPYTIAGFFTEKQELESYLDTGARVGVDKDPGRINAIAVPLQQLSRDPITLAFGFGIGNASKSNLGAAFTGAHYAVYRRYTIATSASAFLLEAGILGVALILLLHWLIFRDALFVARHDHGLVGILAQGSVASVIIVTAGLFYVALHVSEAASYMFWFLAGLISARRERIRIA
jgi:hypothetical protein